MKIVSPIEVANHIKEDIINKRFSFTFPYYNTNLNYALEMLRILKLMTEGLSFYRDEGYDTFIKNKLNEHYEEFSKFYIIKRY